MDCANLTHWFALSGRPALLFPALPSKTRPTWYAAGLLFYPAVLAVDFAIDRAGDGPVQVSLTGQALDVA
jgi:hypothetical protein